MVNIIEAVLSDAEVSEFCSLLDSADWLDGKDSAGQQAAMVKSNLQLDDQSALAQKLSQYLLQKLGANPYFISAALPEKIYPPKFNCYRDGGHYGKHIDSAILYPPGQSSLRSDLSATLFLSAPDTYAGGELILDTALGEYAVKLNAGDMVLYPSTTLHQVTPVTTGQRRCAFFWVQSMVRDTTYRQQLWELDQSIQALSQSIGQNHPDVQRLTGVYHNLLRAQVSL